MLTTLTMSRFRAFESFDLDALARVNLVVGKNNSGKTSVLEAVEFHASHGDPDVIYDAAARRDELGPEDWSPGRRLATVAHMFHGHAVEPGATFAVKSGGCSVRADLQALDQCEEVLLERMSVGSPPSDLSPAMVMAVTSGEQDAPEVALPVTEDGLLLNGMRRRWRHRGPVRFLPLTSIAPPFMAETWNDLVSEGNEGQVVDDMRLLIPEIDSIHFLTASRTVRGGIVVGQRGGGTRIPLGSFGDGMRRLLLLRLALAGNNAKCILVDEVDTGLHWTVMASMWRLVVEVAKRSNLQVFATTHSFDCIRGLASMIKNHPELADEVSVQKVDPSLRRAVSVEGPDIPVAVERGVEFR